MRLEPIRPEHADAVQRLARDPLVTATTTLPEPYPDGGAAWWIADLLPRREAGREHVFAMRVEDGEVAGVVGIADVEGPGGSAELGYWVGVPYWGRGYATAACVMAVDFAFGWLDLAKLHAYPLRENAASRRVLEKAGFRLEAIIPNKYPKWGSERSLAHYVITRKHRSGGYTSGQHRHGRGLPIVARPNPDYDRIVRLLQADVQATLGSPHAETVLEFRANAAALSTDGDFARRLVDEVQQFFLDTYVSTVWPVCPRHPHHPLWFHDGWWCCEADDAAVAPLGSLDAVSRPPR